MRIALVTDAPGDPPTPELVRALEARAETHPIALDAAAGTGTELGRTAAAISRLEPLLRDAEPAAVVTVGDGNAALAAALVAAKLGLPAARAGAGVRSGDRRDADEINRVVADHVCDLLLCAGELELGNLAREGLADKAELVGGAQGAGPATADAIVDWAGSYTSGP
ncbi:MAG TPA: UDP-N-acetylglucosamine 2-epimerase [Solirubrobacterales bacterium]|jgi:UDP-N-acetylglucosamine 2-epimerase|nr:UDP-N-acetylglucosamine 2-epimerase [Solirubrobacterales bacterium]